MQPPPALNVEEGTQGPPDAVKGQEPPEGTLTCPPSAEAQGDSRWT